MNIEDMQKELAEKIAALDLQRKEEAARFAKEMADRNAIAEIERSERIAHAKAAEEKALAKKKAEAEAEQARKQEELKTRQKMENDLAAAAEAKRIQEEKLEWLLKEIANQEFIEEQHRKSVQIPVAVPCTEETANQIDWENPTAPDNAGNAVKQTDGSTPDTPLMSEHLKRILRQAQRS